MPTQDDQRLINTEHANVALCSEIPYLKFMPSSQYKQRSALSLEARVLKHRSLICHPTLNYMPHVSKGFQVGE